jgi:hypothetical protein
MRSYKIHRSQFIPLEYQYFSTQSPNTLTHLSNTDTTVQLVAITVGPLHSPTLTENQLHFFSILEVRHPGLEGRAER